WASPPTRARGSGGWRASPSTRCATSRCCSTPRGRCCSTGPAPPSSSCATGSARWPRSPASSARGTGAPTSSPTSPTTSTCWKRARWCEMPG
ncbi:MAG: Coenzyme PQQ synthesis protein D, partial [uncultured Gemmatimonadaceae bacterium]